jgi:hypothetical protein
MAWNPFVNKTQAWLETELGKAQQDLADGKSTISAGSGDVNASSAIHMSPAARIQLLLKALHAVAPNTYAANAISRDTLVAAQFYDE